MFASDVVRFWFHIFSRSGPGENPGFFTITNLFCARACSRAVSHHTHQSHKDTTMALPTCTTTGASNCFLDVPAMSAFVCAPSPSDGEITEILFTHTPLETADMADAEAFAARIDNTGVDTNAIIRLKVTGKLNAPEVSESELEGGVTVQSARKKFSIEADFYNDTDANYNAVRSFMHCGKPVLLYFVMGGKLYGGDSNAIDGISTIPNILPSSEGRDSYLKYTVRASWRATTMPARVAYPLA